MNDHPIGAVREARNQISARFGHDPRKLIEYYQKLQQRHADRLISPGSQLPETEAPAEEELAAQAEK